MAMTDIDQLERDINDAPGEIVAFAKNTILEVLAEMRLGQAALRLTPIVQAEARVSTGYFGTDHSLAA